MKSWNRFSASAARQRSGKATTLVVEKPVAAASSSLASRASMEAVRSASATVKPLLPDPVQDRPHHGRRARRDHQRALRRAAGRAARAARRRSGLTVADALRTASIDAREARLLLAAATGFSTTSVVAFPERCLAAEAENRFHDFIHRRKSGEPVAYILGRKEFYGLELSVNPAVLIRSEEHTSELQSHS